MALRDICISIVMMLPFFGCLVDQAESAQKINKDGYAITFSYEQLGKKFKAQGFVEGGKSCNQLNISIWFANKKDTGLANVKIVLPNYHKSSRGFKVYDPEIYADKRYRHDWYVDLITTDCL